MSGRSGYPPAPSPTRRLPKQPSLEQLRKQAKELLKKYRACDADGVGGEDGTRGDSGDAEDARMKKRRWFILGELCQSPSMRTYRIEQFGRLP